MKTLPLLSLLLVPLLVVDSRADDLNSGRAHNWHQWRGPNADGVALHGDPPLKWDEKTNVKWKARLPGRGSSTPIVWKDQVFVLTAIDTGKKADPKDIPRPNPRFQKRTVPPTTWHQFVVLSLDRTTGKELWRAIAAEAVPHEGHHDSHSYAAGSPTTDGQRLYVSFGSQGLFCFDLKGKLLWKRDLGRMETRLGWGEASTPVIHGDRLILNRDHEGPSALHVFDAATGKTIHEISRPDEVSTWNTPLVVRHDGVDQVIVTGKTARSYDLATGKVLWQAGGHSINAIPSSVSDGKTAYVMTGYRAHLLQAVPLTARGDLTGTDRFSWVHKRGTPYVPSPLLADGRLWFNQFNEPILSCLDARTGKVLYERQRLPVRQLYASPVAVKDRIYIPGRDGKTVVLKKSDRFEVLAVNELDDTLDASPVVVGKNLFLRGHKTLYCLE
jgi:outer membrane protein assembly factor BamB